MRMTANGFFALALLIVPTPAFAETIDVSDNHGGAPILAKAVPTFANPRKIESHH